MTFRVPAAALAALAGLAAAAPTASATEIFATTDAAKTTQDCLTEATACALGRALAQVPNALVGGGSPFGKHTLTLLPGRYDDDDLDAGAGPFGNVNLRVPLGALVGGKPTAERPVLAFGNPGLSTPAVEIRSGGALRDVAVECTSFVCVSAQGLDQNSGVGEVPGRVERVRIASAPAPGGNESYGLSLDVVTVASNVDVAHTAPKGGAVVINDDDADLPAPKLVAATATSAQGSAVFVSGGRLGKPQTIRVPIINSVLRGTADLDAKSDAFNTAPPPGFQPNPIEVVLTNSAVRSGPSRVLAGPVTVVETGTVDVADLGLGVDRIPAAGSALVDAGKADADLGALDLLGNTRTTGVAPEIGAYERAAAPAPGNLPPTGNPGGAAAAPAAPAPAGSSAPLTSLVDTKGPTATVTPPKSLKRSKLTKGKGVSLTATVSETLASAKVELLQITKKKGKAPKEKILGSATLGAGGPSLTFALKVNASKLAKKGKQKLTLRFTFVDAAGNKTVVDKPVTVG